MIKWFLVGLLLLLTAGGAGYGLYVALQPEMVTAKAMFLAESTPASWKLDGESAEPSDRQISEFRQTLEAYCTAPSVLTAALQNPNLQGTFLSDVNEPYDWLEDHVVAKFEGKSALLAIRLEGLAEQAEDLRTIVEAVSQAFTEEVVMKDRFDRAKQLDTLKVTHGEYQERLRQKLTELARERSESGRAAAGNIEIRMLTLEIQSLERIYHLLADRIQIMELDLELPAQVRLVDPPYIEDSKATDFK